LEQPPIFNLTFNPGSVFTIHNRICSFVIWLMRC